MLLHRCDALAREASAHPEQHHTQHGGASHRELVAKRLVAAAQHVHELQREGADQQRCEHGQEHPERCQRGAVAGVVGHQRRHRRVRDVDEAVADHHQRVGDVGVQQLVAGVAGRHREGGDGGHRQQRRTEHQVGPALAPARAGAVDQRAQQQVPAGIDGARHEQQGSYRCCAEPEHVGVEKHQERAERGEHQVAGEVAQAVGQLLAQRQAGLDHARAAGLGCGGLPDAQGALHRSHQKRQPARKPKVRGSLRKTWLPVNAL